MLIIYLKFTKYKEIPAGVNPRGISCIQNQD